MQGDSFFFGFQSAGDAVVAAAEAQRRLGDLDWQAGPPITVRIGIHTGEPTVSDSLYAGLDVHRAARVMAAAHGGQVLLSARTADLVGGDLPDDLRLRPLGRYMLKDFAAGEPLAQVEGAGLEARFPRLRAERQPSRVLRGVPRPVRRHPLVFSALIAALVAAVAVPLSLIGPPPIEFQANALAELDAHSGKRVAVVPVGDTPSAVAAAGRDLWVANAGEATISRIDTKLGRVVRTIPVGGTPVGITVGAGAAWVLNSDLAATKSTVSRVDLRYSQVTARIALPPSQLIGSGAGISWDGRDIWAATQAGSVFRISPRTERVLDSVAAGNDPISLAPAAGSVWVANRRNATVIRVEAPATITATVPVGQQPTAIAA